VRELQNAMERAAILNESEITAADLGIASRNPAPGAEEPRLREREKIETTLRECKWNKAAAAERLGISYKTFLAKIKTYELD